ncbi:hypothetical protein sos41_07050 [Alphaproteobacteria bacterium SO-S41]|nr:hypothetical protein sos41_07050 [Alphaproteobacteria bacterium SO-S41]
MKNLSPAARKLGFQIHAITFVLTLIGLAVVNYLVGPPPWVLWVLASWSVGLLMHWWFDLGPGAPKANTRRLNA